MSGELWSTARVRRSRGKLWLLMPALLMAAATCFLVEQDDEAASPRPEAPPAPAAAVTPPVVPASDDDLVTVDASVDAGDEAAVDAGSDARVADGPEPGDAPREPTPEDVAALVARWKQALGPVLHARRPVPPKIVTAESHKPDAPPPCDSGPRSWPLARRPRVDLVVGVDTSGSMWGGGLDAAADFLGRLEHQLVLQGGDWRLQVVAEPRHLQLPDAGVVIDRHIDSLDGFEVLLQTAPRWLAGVERDSELRVVLVTDDSPFDRSDAATLWRRLSAEVGERPAPPSFSVVGGFDPLPGLALLGPTDPRSPGTCRTPAFRGMSPGRTWQDLAVLSAGVRAPLCNVDGRAAAAEVLGLVPALVSACRFALEPGARVTHAIARHRDGHDLYLLPEPVPVQCPGLERSYVTGDDSFTLCPDSCAELVRSGFQSIEAQVLCAP